MQVVHRLTTSNPFAVIPSHPFMIDSCKQHLDLDILYIYVYIYTSVVWLNKRYAFHFESERYIYIYLESKQYITKRYLGVIPHSFFGQLPSGLNIHSCRKQSDPWRKYIKAIPNLLPFQTITKYESWPIYKR